MYISLLHTLPTLKKMVILPIGLYGCGTWHWRCLGLKRDQAISLEENVEWRASCYAVTKHYGSYMKRDETDGARGM